MKFLAWLEKPAQNTEEKLSNLFSALFLALVWILVIRSLKVFQEGDSVFEQDPFTIADFVSACILAPLWEEAAFRHFPLKAAKSMGINTLLMMIGTSFVFGFIHGDITNVFVQGVGGFLFALLYIKNGYSYISSVIIHFFWDLMVVFLLPSLF